MSTPLAVIIILLFYLTIVINFFRNYINSLGSHSTDLTSKDLHRPRLLTYEQNISFSVWFMYGPLPFDLRHTWPHSFISYSYQTKCYSNISNDFCVVILHSTEVLLP